jgi:subtilase family serine protease
LWSDGKLNAWWLQVNYETANVCFTVKNTGISASALSTARVKISAQNWSVKRLIGGLASGKSIKTCVEITVDLPAGVHRLEIKADAFNQVAESKENNNELVYDFWVK